MSEREMRLAEELERTRDDAGEWGEERVQIDVRPARSQVVSFRLPLGELEELTGMAEAAGETVSDFIRRAIEFRIRHAVAPSVYVTHTAQMMTVQKSPASSGRNEPDPFYVTHLGKIAATH
jgi:Ribbon-helix-helix protein, copG family.